ncbi:MAG TPA: helix-turn-helix transcriptional regulator [Mycobacteriales bacterium]|nr:helix-turn-helix transcriptional regulator [Mycobacteriales bacterium]
MAKLSELKNIDEVIEEHRGTDPEFRERWDRARFARAVAVKIIKYRSEHGLTQTQLAREVGTTQSVIGRLELGEQPPSLATLAKLTARTGLEFHLDITGGDVALSA